MTQGPGFTEASVLDFVVDLHAKNPTQRQFGLAEIAEAMAPDQVAAFKASAIDGLTWVGSLNNLLKKLGADGQLAVTTVADYNGVPCAVVSFPAETAGSL
jgi:hypothetical protein